MKTKKDLKLTERNKKKIVKAVKKKLVPNYPEEDILFLLEDFHGDKEDIDIYDFNDYIKLIYNAITEPDDDELWYDE